ncbi:TetR/AcrR family transcriptional regulator [Cytobacillus sp. S13-E01]|uniref:TetR/AcrR family transcriptional regulator n=1 Tax=Cytobacillus sp. S13-E01 TaxID=3031326 RepID=UPI0023D802DD|nr:TetR/AcrR family transcriptional regulator [Cytobacillus sp. S13-E01]MDF0725425.1 TetR/AcrR family transcriptional regulator [Cytobacillus sp. S13-E01]
MKERITEQSKALFEKKGFTETSIQDIVDSLGVTKGTFYYYFSSKEELLMDIHIRYIENLLHLQAKILADTSKDCKTKLYEIVYMLIHIIEEQGASARVFFRELRNLNEEHLSQILPKRDQFRLNLQTLLEQGVKDGEFRGDLSVEIVTFGILGITNWSYNWFNPKGKLKDKEVARIFVEMILNGIED